MAPRVDLLAFFGGLGGWEVAGIAACGLLASFGVAYLVERFIFAERGR